MKEQSEKKKTSINFYLKILLVLLHCYLSFTVTIQKTKIQKKTECRKRQNSY